MSTSTDLLDAQALAAGFVAPLASLGVIRVAGDDAAAFLHGQLTNDVAGLGLGEARLAGYCTPKGRLLATMLMWRDADGICLQLPASLQPAIQKRLGMYVLRAKAKLTDATPEATLGLGGAAAGAALQAAGAALPAAANGVSHGANGTVIRLTDVAGAPRYLWMTDAASAAAALPALRGALAAGGEQAWQLAAIHAGLPQITPATQEQFVPQMVNLELLGGVHFKKGCYPGQEIVARSQYLGKLKRRTALASVADANVQAGAEVFSADDPGQPCGMVVNAAPNGRGGADLLVELKLAALDAPLFLGAAGGTPLQVLPMPYALDALDV